MDYLQYYKISKWNGVIEEVLNLIINGLPSILGIVSIIVSALPCFKPYYKWITFNTENSYRCRSTRISFVLNLIINGLPSIPKEINEFTNSVVELSFKPYYKWITFNTFVIQVQVLIFQLF